MYSFVNNIWVLGVMIEEGHENSAYDNILDGKYKHFVQISVWELPMTFTSVFFCDIIKNT